MSESSNLRYHQDEVTRLRAALADALEGMEDMIGYVTPYFIDKWDHVGYINRARVALRLPEVTVTSEADPSLPRA